MKDTEKSCNSASCRIFSLSCRHHCGCLKIGEYYTSTLPIFSRQAPRRISRNALPDGKPNG